MHRIAQRTLLAEQEVDLGAKAYSQLHVYVQVLGGYQDKASQLCFSPVFDLELDAKQGGSNHFDRCFSHQQLQGEDAGGSSGSLLQQILALCRCGSPIQAQVRTQALSSAEGVPQHTPQTDSPFVCCSVSGGISCPLPCPSQMLQLMLFHILILCALSPTHTHRPAMSCCRAMYVCAVAATAAAAAVFCVCHQWSNWPAGWRQWTQ